MIYKKCSKCDVNYIKSDEDLCEICKESEIRNIKPSNILHNYQLRGQIFKVDLSGYGAYLMSRKYGTYTDKGTESTTMSYVRSIIKIAQLENLFFEDLMENVDRLVYVYGLDGTKKELGEKGNGTWRNALNRLKDFKEYISLYMGKQSI